MSCAVELRHLEYFVAVAEELSFTRASRRLHMVQSGVSSAIQALEHELDAVLFNRDRHRVALTDAGRALLPEARAALAAAQAARDAVGEARAGLRGTLTIGTMQSTGKLDLPALLGAFYAAHPGVLVRLRLSSAGSVGLAGEVLSGDLNLALLSLPGRPPAGLNLTPVGAELLLLACPPHHALARRQQASLVQLAGEAFIDFTPGWGNRAVVDRAFAAAGLEREVRFEVADFVTAASLVRNGLGVAFLPESFAAGLPDLPTVRIAGAQLSWPVSVATAARRPLSAAGRAFLAELMAAARGPAHPAD
jgi:DNA-binding transcriptional LysR family regulator